MRGLNWRGQAARAYVLYDAGEAFWLKAKNLAVAGAAVKILFDVPLSTMLLCSPIVVAFYLFSGWAWLRYGWLRQQHEVNAIHNFNPIQRFELEALCRLLKHNGLPVNGYDPGVISDELRHVLASTRR